MVVFHNGFVDELATKQVTANGHGAAADADRLLCPLQHEDGCVDGQPSLAYRLWQLLDSAGPSGLQTSLLAARTSSSVADVQTTLECSRYFIQLPESGKWALAVLQPLRWGVVGCGKLAEDFAAVLAALVPGAQLIACCDPIDLARAKSFAAAHGCKRAYGACDELAADAEVDVVHVAVVNTAHCDAALAMVAGGKAVLVEKTFAMDEAQAAEVIAAARRQGVFCMEGMWQRFFPASGALRALLRGGAIGRPLSVDARKTFLADESHQRLVDPALGGGALLDVGCYVHSLAAWVFEQPAPSEVASLSVRHHRGADAAGSAVYRFGDGELATLTYSFLQASAKVAHVYGTAGAITIDGMDCPDRLTVTRHDGSPPQVLCFPRPAEVPGAAHGPAEHGGLHWPDSGGLAYEAMAVHSAVLKGWREMPEMTHADTLGMARTFDVIRAQAAARLPEHATLEQGPLNGNVEQDKTGGDPVAVSAAKKGSTDPLNGFAGTVNAATLIEPATAA